VRVHRTPHSQLDSHSCPPARPGDGAGKAADRRRPRPAVLPLAQKLVDRLPQDLPEDFHAEGRRRASPNIGNQRSAATGPL